MCIPCLGIRQACGNADFTKEREFSQLLLLPCLSADTGPSVMLRLLRVQHGGRAGRRAVHPSLAGRRYWSLGGVLADEDQALFDELHPQAIAQVGPTGVPLAMSVTDGACG